eukprot:gene45082-56119_t
MEYSSHATGDSMNLKGKRSCPEPADSDQHPLTESQDDPDNDDQHQKYIKRDESEDGDETPENSTTTSDRLPWSNEVVDYEADHGVGDDAMETDGGEDADEDSRRGEDYNSSFDDDEGSQSADQHAEAEQEDTKNDQSSDMDIATDKAGQHERDYNSTEAHSAHHKTSLRLPQTQLCTAGGYVPGPQVEPLFSRARAADGERIDKRASNRDYWTVREGSGQHQRSENIGRGGAGRGGGGRGSRAYIPPLSTIRETGQDRQLVDCCDDNGTQTGHEADTDDFPALSTAMPKARQQSWPIPSLSRPPPIGVASIPTTVYDLTAADVQEAGQIMRGG